MRYEINELMIKNGFIYDKDKKVENIVIPGVDQEYANRYYRFMKSQSSVSQIIGAKCLALPISKIIKFYSPQPSTTQEFHYWNTFDDNLEVGTNLPVVWATSIVDGNVILSIPKKHYDEIIDQLQDNAAVTEQAELDDENIRQNPPSYLTNPKKKADYVAALRHYYPDDVRVSGKTDVELMKNTLKQLQAMLSEIQLAANATAEIEAIIINSMVEETAVEEAIIINNTVEAAVVETITT